MVGWLSTSVARCEIIRTQGLFACNNFPPLLTTAFHSYPEKSRYEPVPLLDLLLVISRVLLQKIYVVLGEGVVHPLALLLVLPPLPCTTRIR